jgi:hypothetical protein
MTCVSPAVKLVPWTVNVAWTFGPRWVPAVFGVKTADVRVGAAVGVAGADVEVVVAIVALVRLGFAADAKCTDIPAV